MPVLRTDALEFDLPQSLIATEPATPRDSARLLVCRRSDPTFRRDATVRELPELLATTREHGPDRMVFNTTRVLPARFLGRREDTGGKVEGLYLRDSAHPVPTGADAVWVVLVKARRFREGAPVALLDARGETTGVRLRLLRREPDEPGGWHVAVEQTSAMGGPAGVLERYGATPLPPYILSARKASGHEADAERDAQRYQTVYADEPGSVAAPTAGLHFTPELLAALTSGGVGRTDVLLHVGSGTFKPVEAGVVEDHDMHAERCVMHERAVEAVRATREARGRVLAVGTTSARTLESYAAETERSGAVPSALDTRLLITPGYRWRWADGLLTNFHLPRSTLLAMVSSLFVRDGEDPGVGVPRLLAHYAHAIESGYRFYSFGDAMLVLP